MKKKDGVIMELSHDEAPGYRTAFYVVFAVAVLYLVLILRYG